METERTENLTGPLQELDLKETSGLQEFFICGLWFGLKFIVEMRGARRCLGLKLLRGQNWDGANAIEGKLSRHIEGS